MSRVLPLIEKDYLLDGGGVYCFYPFDLLDRGKGVFKIGMTSHYHGRINSYHTYFPMGMYMKC